MLKVEQLSGGYSNEPIVKNVSFQVQKGELFGILGPNGSGKTTLLKMISGILPFQSGTISIKGQSIKSFSMKELAKMMAVLSQHSSQAFSYTVKETVSLGRYAHQTGWFRSWSEEDERIVQEAMEQTGIHAFQNKSIQELSGGERQRVFLAQSLVQEPEILLLDEPTNHLDLSYQKELLDLLKQWTREKGLTVISIFHDLNLASLYCDRLLLLENGSVHTNAVPNEVVKVDKIKEVYDTDVEKHPHPSIPVPQMVLLPNFNGEENIVEIGPEFMRFSKEHISLHAPLPLRTMSSGVIGSGVGWHQTFVNRHVDKTYDCSDHRNEMHHYLKEHGFEPSPTIGMMTAVWLDDVSYKLIKGDNFSIFVIVTAGVSNAVDASKSDQHSFEMVPGTINTWIFVNGQLTEEAFIQSIMTATEAKVKVMDSEKVLDLVTGTTATGTSTDSILIAATQMGKKLEFAGTITPLGKLISQGVFECTTEAIRKSRKRLKAK
ncbi:heme ABC transporter ATP-binding protein [Robertmurraya kyonggiensis]|uniref:Heme ABC transporter ATP-binding protein n=1 Tax=Robertmurraya kyonggiensis TaxID=1037680 RepID=A0A4V5P215_9BACI|nr:heme ABC transporter ATP-binding protein [Robertmurraya kyonggiensis]TKC14850.1 heme ABC transporter ATP-binding protein [Robertmurraya kyonggiensis]